MANNNLASGLRQAQQFMQVNTSYNVELVKGKNEKQATRMHVYLDDKLIADISTSAYTKNDFINMLEDIKENKSSNNSMASSKVEHAWKYGNIDKQARTYVKDELYSNNATSDEAFLSVAQDFSNFNWMMFLNGLLNNGYVLNSNDINYYVLKAKEYFNTNPIDNFIKIGKDMFLTKHTYKKVMDVKKAYKNYLKACQSV